MSHAIPRRVLRRHQEGQRNGALRASGLPPLGKSSNSTITDNTSGTGRIRDRVRGEGREKTWAKRSAPQEFRSQNSEARKGMKNGECETPDSDQRDQECLCNFVSLSCVDIIVSKNVLPIMILHSVSPLLTPDSCLPSPDS